MNTLAIEDLQTRIGELEDALRGVAAALSFVMSTVTATVTPSYNRFALNPPPPETVTLEELYRRTLAGATVATRATR
jgi:hypothetical protein